MVKGELAVGVDLGGTNIAAGVVDHKGRVLGRAKKKTRAAEGRDAVLDRMVAAIEEACAAAGVTLAEVSRVGVGAPGPVEHERGVVRTAGNLGWKEVPLRDLLRKRVSIPVLVDNDVNVAAWGEAVLGAGQGCANLLAVWVGTGVGGGMVLNGKVWHGDLHTAGEIGRTIVYPGGQPGNTCLEEFCSRTGIVRSIMTRLGFYPESPFRKLLARQQAEGRSKPVGSGAIAECYEAGDELVREVVDASAELLGTAVANWITLTSVRTVVLGGGVAEALGKPYAQRVSEAVRRHVFPAAIAGKVEVHLTRLKGDAGVIGAAMLE